MLRFNAFDLFRPVSFAPVFFHSSISSVFSRRDSSSFGGSAPRRPGGKTTRDARSKSFSSTRHDVINLYAQNDTCTTVSYNPAGSLSVAVSLLPSGLL